MTKVSIIIPVYFNAGNLLPLYSDLCEKVFHKSDDRFELIFVDDGSKDESWAEIQELSKTASISVKSFHLSRNFGSHAAILCGLENCSGDCAVIKAADMQEPSEIILEMISQWKEGNNVVLAVREDRPEHGTQLYFSNFYYWLVRKTALKAMPEKGFDIFLVDRKVISVLGMMDEKNSALTGQILWSGFRTAMVPYKRQVREIGKSRWTLSKKFRLVMDTLYSFSTIPITIVMGIGFLSFVGGLIWTIVVLINKIAGNIPVSGFTTMFIFQLMSFGVIMCTLGIIGGYLWRTFDAARNRPVYIIEDKAENHPEA